VNTFKTLLEERPRNCDRPFPSPKNFGARNFQAPTCNLGKCFIAAAKNNGLNTCPVNSPAAHRTRLSTRIKHTSLENLLRKFSIALPNEIHLSVSSHISISDDRVFSRGDDLVLINKQSPKGMVPFVPSALSNMKSLKKKRFDRVQGMILSKSEKDIPLTEDL
jgi:hypothetical protein